MTVLERMDGFPRAIWADGDFRHGVELRRVEPDRQVMEYKVTTMLGKRAICTVLSDEIVRTLVDVLDGAIERHKAELLTAAC